MTITTTRKVGRPADPSLPQRRKTEILAAASSIFAERGYRNTDVQLIAEALQVGKGTIYRYFSSKETLFLAAVDQGMSLLTDIMLEAADGFDEPLDRTRAVVFAYLQHFRENPDLAELIIQERAEFRRREKPTYFFYADKRRSRWRDALQSMIDSGRCHDDVTVEKLFDGLSSMLYGAMFINFFNGETKSVAEQSKEILDIYLHGVLKEAQHD